MEYKVDNKKINIKNLRFLGSGCEGEVFKWKNYALKIKYNDTIGLSYDDCHYMRNIATSNILMPKGIFYSNNRYSGYTTRYISHISNFNLIDVPKDYLINNILIPIEEDLRILSNRKVTLSDLTLSNTIKNDSLYLIDPGSYVVLKDLSSESINSINLEELRDYLNTLINQELKKYKLNYEIGECDSFSYYIKNEISNNLSIKEYILKK